MPALAEDGVCTPDTADTNSHEHSQIATNSALEDLQTDEQRTILDTVSQVRKCGLDNILSLPQIVVCGDQSAGKSSVLEALTEIPFPRNDNLCTRFATEISLRREPVACLTIRVIPDGARPQGEQDTIKAFSESITNFGDLPAIMEQAMKVMGIHSSDLEGSGSTFARDTLSVEIQGPDRPQLTLVDIPGLIQTSTRGVSEADIAMVAEITDSYIKQPRTVCLAVVSATNDAANQPILQRVRRFDRQGERTLGVVTKPDRLSHGSGSETKFLELARNEDVFFKLGWHVIKNRKFEESECSIEERNLSEKTFFSVSNFRTLPMEDVGIDMLRVKLSHLLFDHVKKELPRLQDDLEHYLKTAQDELRLLGASRSTPAECRMSLTQLAMDCHELCQAGLEGQYRGSDFFKHDDGFPADFSLNRTCTTARIRAAIQTANTSFADELRRMGHKYQIGLSASDVEPTQDSAPANFLTRPEALGWVRNMVLRSRGRELVGNFNPHVVAELFWEQSEPWEKLANAHLHRVSKLCEKFLGHLLDHVVPKDVKKRMWSALVQDALESRHEAALAELDKLLRDRRDFPINYNHYYTDTIHKKRQARVKTQIQRHIPDNFHEASQKCSAKKNHPQIDVHDELNNIIRQWANNASPDMEIFSCEEALDCLMAIYKVPINVHCKAGLPSLTASVLQVQQKTFLANVTTQVVERHIVRSLHAIFSPMIVVNMPDTKAQSIISEPAATRRQRAFLTDRVKKLEDGQDIFRNVLDG